MTALVVDRAIDLRRASLGALRAVDFRAPGRDYWADEAAIHDRFVAVWFGLDDAAWLMPGAAPSDAGGPDWSLHDSQPGDSPLTDTRWRRGAARQEDR